jgi:peptide/nickel transport system substrate-binding protein
MAPKSPRTIGQRGAGFALTDRRGFLRLTGVSTAAIAGSSLLAACGDSDSSGGSSGSSASKTLRFGPVGDAQNYDPATNGLDYSAPPFSAIYEGLTAYAPGSSTWEPQMLLAESVEPSEDGLSYKFKLKEGSQFHGGFGEVTAKDVKYSFERAAGLIDLFPGATKKDVSYYAGDFPNLDQVQVTGKYTGVIKFKKPFSPFETITLPYATSGFIIPQAAVEKYGSKFPQHPVGTGPYEVASYTPNSEMVLRKFKDYGGAWDALGATYAFDEIHLKMTALNSVPKGEALTVPLQSGDVDFTPALGMLDVNNLKSNSAYTTYVADAPLSYSFIALDVKNEKLTDQRVRQAIRYALDIDQLNQADGVPSSARMDSLIPQGMVGYWQDGPKYARDVAKAKSLLADAGAENLEIELAAPTIATLPGAPNQVMQVIQSQLKEAGITVKIISNPPNSYLAKPGVGELTWGQFGGAPDPYYQFEWWTCDQVGVWNYASWCNPKFSANNTQLGIEGDEDTRTSLAVQMQQYMADDVPLIFAHSGVNFSASSSHIKAVFDNNGNPNLQFFQSV